MPTWSGSDAGPLLGCRVPTLFYPPLEKQSAHTLLIVLQIIMVVVGDGVVTAVALVTSMARV